MPHSQLHKKKLSKNLFILALVFGMCVLIWMITMVKMAGAHEIFDGSDHPHPGVERKAKQVFDISESYIDGRKKHIADQEKVYDRWWYEDVAVGGEDTEIIEDDDDKGNKAVKLKNERRLRATFGKSQSGGLY